jgi:hypothetical protein
MNGYPPFGQMQQMPQVPQQQFFPQPQGNVFMINSSSEIGNIPIGNGLSAAICLQEGTLYLKTMQNGNLMSLAYKLSPLDTAVNTTQSNPQSGEDNKILQILQSYEQRIKAIEDSLSIQKENKGGKNEWQL